MSSRRKVPRVKLLIVTSMVRTRFKIDSVGVKVANNLKVVLTPIKLDLMDVLTRVSRSGEILCSSHKLTFWGIM